MIEYEFDQTKNPEPFEERIEILRNLGKGAEKKFEKKYSELAKYFDEYDQLNLMSFASYYLFTSKEGEDEEANTGTIEFPPHLQEILQALSLTKARNYEPRPFIGSIPQDLKNCLKELKESLDLKFFNLPDEVKTENDLEKYKLRIDFMADTMAVRGWCYNHQLTKMVDDLCLGIDKDFYNEFGFEPNFIFEIIDKLLDNVNIKLKIHQERIRDFVCKNDYTSIINAYETSFPHVKKTTNETKKKLFELFNKDLKQLKAVFLSHSDLFLYKIFTFSVDDIFGLIGGKLDKSKIDLIMDKLSCNFGDLKGEDKSHFILNNPIHKKPFIKVDEESYFSSILGTVEHLKLDLLEFFVKDKVSLNSKFSKVKAEYLENSVKNLFEINFPDAAIHQNVYWFDEKKQRHETDLVVSVNDFLFIVESKSGILTESAKRGATERLFKNLKDLVESPSYQASKFISFINSQDTELFVFDKKKRRRFLHKPKYIIPLGVTLTQFGVNSTILKKLIKLEFFDKVDEITSSINLNDLEIVFEVLESIPQKIHYLQRRREIEVSLDFVGDEMDLLAMYLENAFNFGEIEGSKTYFLNLILLSKKIDKYIINSNNGYKDEKPKLELTKWWGDILGFLSERKPKNWIENSYILLNITYDDQVKFEKLFKQQSEDMVNGSLQDKNSNFLIYKSANIQRQFAIVGFNYLDIEKKERDQQILNIIQSEEENTKGIIVIGSNLRKKIYPYSFLASKLDPELFVS